VFALGAGGAGTPPRSAGSPGAEVELEREAMTERPPALEPADAAPVPDADGAASGAEQPAAAEREASPEDDRVRSRIVAAARRRLGTRPKLDCSGYVLDAYRRAGLAVRLGPGRSRSEALARASRPVDAPRPGDLAFFHDTYDRNRDGRADDAFTHVALVESVDGDEVTLLHRGGRVQRIRMDLSHPSDPTLNDTVRVHRRMDAPGTRYLAGELFTAFGELLDSEFTQMLQAGRAVATGRAHPGQDERGEDRGVRRR
jgi:peptidoglycan DL-endopeptidase CwlO